MEKKCAYCGNIFEARRSTAEYCSNSHRVLAFRQRELQESGVVVDYKSPQKKSENELLGESVSAFCNENNCTFEDLKAAFLKPQPPKKAISEPKVSAQPPKQNSKLSFIERRRLQKNGQ
jgi:hypothetical protein